MNYPHRRDTLAAAYWRTRTGRNRNRGGRAIGVSSGKPERYLSARRRGLRRFAGGLITLVVVLCALAVFA